MLSKINALWLKVEKAGVVAGFLVMSVVVFADVFHREAAEVIAAVAWSEPAAGEEVDAAVLEDSRARKASATKTAVVLAVAFSGLGWAAVRTATRGATPHPKAAALGVGIAAAILLGAWIFVKLFPAGVIWAQTLALVLTIWVGFLGASIATAEQLHLKVDAAEKIFVGDAKKWVSITGDVIAALFTGFLAALGVVFCASKYSLWSDTDGAAGVFQGLPLPMFIAFAGLPITLFTMSARFLALAILKYQGRAPVPKAHADGAEVPS